MITTNNLRLFSRKPPLDPVKALGKVSQMRIKNFVAFFAVLLVFLSFSMDIVAEYYNINLEITAQEKKLVYARGKNRIDILNQLVHLYGFISRTKAMMYGNQALEECKKIDYPQGKAHLLLNLIDVFDASGQTGNNGKYCREALDIFNRLNDREGIARAYLYLGDEAIQLRQFDNAFTYFMDALQIFKELGHMNYQIQAIWYLGTIYRQKNDYKKALEYSLKALEMLKNTDHNEYEGHYLLSTGLCYHLLDENATAISYMNRALELAKKEGKLLLSSLALTYIGSIYIIEKQPLKAMPYLLQARQLLENTDCSLEKIENLINIGDCHRELKKFQQSLTYYHHALELAEKMANKKILESVFRNITYTYYQLENYKQAFEFYRKYTKIKEEIFNIEKNRQLEELRIKYDSEQQNKKIQLLEKDNKIRRMTANTFIAGFILVLIILALLFKRFLYFFAFWKKQKTIGQYRLLEPIGSGGMGTVYEAHRIYDKHETAAIKILRDELSEDEVNRQRFKREGTIIDKLDHPHIVRIFERGEFKGKLYIAMELLHGQTLDQKLKQSGPFSLPIALPIMIQTCSTLSFIHENNIVHRDLKPANIMLIEQPNQPISIKLLDFGLAIMRFHSRVTRSGELVGTIHYISPEQITDGLYLPAGDVYALGMIFSEILSGKPLFSDKSVATIIEKILDSKSPELNLLIPSIPPSLLLLIENMLNKNYQKRPSTKEVLSTLETLK